MHRGTREVLARHGVPCPRRVAVQLTRAEYNKYDLILGMENANIRNMLAIFGGDPENKVARLLNRDVADPWYTGNFEVTYADITEGCKQLLEKL